MRSHATTSNPWDLAGIFVSGLCVLHCSLLPLTYVVIPTLSLGIWGTCFLHRIFAVIALVIACVALGPSLRKQMRSDVALFAGAGLGLLFASGYLPRDLLRPVGELALTIPGSALLVTAHCLNHLHAPRLKNYVRSVAS